MLEYDDYYICVPVIQKQYNSNAMYFSQATVL